MKIKIFSGDNLKTLENNVNRFIKDKNVTAINQSESPQEGCASRINLTLTVLYEDFYKYEYVNSRISKDSL
ncbi:MAG: hypothetical protein N2376_06045 [Clostridia bacterium]|nr:hypothetical protein [Clostridia bacterium]